jgi:hypothetical protein
MRFNRLFARLSLEGSDSIPKFKDFFVRQIIERARGHCHLSQPGALIGHCRLGRLREISLTLKLFGFVFFTHVFAAALLFPAARRIAGSLRRLMPAESTPAMRRLSLVRIMAAPARRWR